MIQLKLQADHQLDLHQDLFYFRVKSHSILFSLKVKFFAYVIHFLMHLWCGLCHVFNLEYSVKIREVALFVQEYIFGLPATSGLKQYKTATYLAVATDIQSYIHSE